MNYLLWIFFNFWLLNLRLSHLRVNLYLLGLVLRHAFNFSNLHCFLSFHPWTPSHSSWFSLLYTLVYSLYHQRLFLALYILRDVSEHWRSWWGSIINSHWHIMPSILCLLIFSELRKCLMLLEIWSEPLNSDSRRHDLILARLLDEVIVLTHDWILSSLLT